MAISSARIPLAKQDEEDPEVKIELIGEVDAQRRDVERFIQVVFRRMYGAKISHFLPYLLGMQQEGKTIAALGVRPANLGKLFLENYLNRPIENVLAAKLARPIDRKRIIEVGNLASVRGGGARALIVTLTAYLYGAGYEWTVFTATAQVRNNFTKLGIELTYLAAADKECLGEAKKDWGSYYEQTPQVMVAGTNVAAQIVQEAIANQRLFPEAKRIWHEAYIAGQQGRLSLPPCTIDTEISSKAFI
jgi:hypothetical protein